MVIHQGLTQTQAAVYTAQVNSDILSMIAQHQHKRVVRQHLVVQHSLPPQLTGTM